MRDRRNYLIILALIALALVGVGFMAVPGAPGHRPLTKGLDLQGGLEVVLKAVPPKGQKLTQEDLDRSVSIMRSRVDKLGVSEPEIRKQDPDQIVIQLAGVHDVNRAAEIIGKTAQLELYDLETSLVRPSIDAQHQPVPTFSLYQLLAPVQAQAKKGEPSAFYVFDTGRSNRVVGGPFTARAQAEQLVDKRIAAAPAKAPKPRTPQAAEPKTTPKKAPVQKGKGGAVEPKTPRAPPVQTKAQLRDALKIFAVPEKTVVITCTAEDRFCPGPQGGFVPNPGQTAYYLFQHDPENGVPQMTGDDLKLSGTQADIDPTTNSPEVLMQFTGHGGKVFEKITRDEWVRGKFRNAPQHFAIVLDREIKSFPQIDYTDNSLSRGIGGGSARITGLESIGEAKDIALVLQTGALPVNYVTIERTDVSATLGKDSLTEAWRAALVGLALVVLFLLVFYRFLGVVAVIGLLIYAALLYGAILLFNVTLTLPGFAGMILTIGVAADANVVIFERIKEEVRAGKSVRSAISAGYGKGFHTIIDANVVTAITALVLFAVATAGVKGFALLLLIGTVISLFTAVAATRALLGLLAGFRWFDNPRFMGATAQEIPRWQRIDVVGRRRLWFVLSLVAIGISAIALGVKGLNLGIDFKGGTQITFTTPKYVPLSDVRAQAADIGHGTDAVVQGRGTARGDTYKSFQIRTKSLTSTDQQKITADLQQEVGAQKLGVKNVSASFSRQIIRGAILAIIVSFALIALYVTMRYQWRFAVPILRTLLNDVLITLGVYAISGREVTTATVAALLTILGFSIYDTIIVFDRVRENIKLMPRASIATIANVSLWEVLRRSIVTSFITLLPIVALFIFGGATLKDFAFAIMVGIVIGAVSTIFIATPLLTVLMERQPDFRRRIGLDDARKPGSAAVLEEAEAAAAAEPTPELVPTTPTGDGTAAAKNQQRRERRQQRRRARPHGRAR